MSRYVPSEARTPAPASHAALCFRLFHAGGANHTTGRRAALLAGMGAHGIPGIEGGA